MRALPLIFTLSLAACTPADATSPNQDRADTLAAQASIPGAAVVFARCGERDSAVAGVTRAGGSLPVTAQSRFNLGSNSKSVLASAAATLVEAGMLSWDMRVADSPAFSELASDNPNRDATLAELFSHTGGIATYHTGAALNTVTVDDPLGFARQALNEPPAGPRGSYAYSNAGPVIAAIIMETATGEPWLDIITQRIVSPWSLDAQLATPIPADSAQLYGHYQGEAGLTVYEEDEAEIAAFLQPSGYLAISPDSYGAYLEHHVCGLQGQASPGLSAPGFQALHTTAYDTPSALGWARQEIQGELFSFHIGSTGAHYAFAMVNADRAIAILVNSGAPEAAAAAQAALLELAAATAPLTGE